MQADLTHSDVCVGSVKVPEQYHHFFPVRLLSFVAFMSDIVTGWLPQYVSCVLAIERAVFIYADFVYRLLRRFRLLSSSAKAIRLLLATG